MKGKRFKEIMLGILLFSLLAFAVGGWFVMLQPINARAAEETILITDQIGIPTQPPHYDIGSATNAFKRIYTTDGVIFDIPKTLSDLALTSKTANINKEYIKSITKILISHRDAIRALNEINKLQGQDKTNDEFLRYLRLLDKRLKKLEAVGVGVDQYPLYTPNKGK